MQEIRKIAVVMFTDIVGYSKFMSNNESNALNILDTNQKFLRNSLKKYNGNLIKNIGDGSLSIFDSAVAAVECGLELIDKVNEYDQFKIRIGIHLGEVVFRNDDIFSDTVRFLNTSGVFMIELEHFIDITIREVKSTRNNSESNISGQCREVNIAKLREEPTSRGISN